MADAVRIPGDTGDRIVEADQAFSIETHGIETIPLADRHGHPRELFWVWLGANVIFTYVIIGSLTIGLGLSFWAAIAAAVVGQLFYFLVGAAAISGPRAGTATIAIARSAFGVLGNVPATALSWITVVGWEAVNIVIGTLALYELALLGGLPESTAVKAVCLALVMLATFLVAAWGHATIVLLNTILSVVLGVGTIGLAIIVLPQLNVGYAGGTLAAQTPFSTWLLALMIVASGPFSWMNYPADYARYLPRETAALPVMLYTAVGSAIPALLITVVGVAAATATDMTDPVAGLPKLLPGWFLVPYLLVIVGGTITNNFLNTYSSGLNLLALGVRLPRYKAVLIDAILGGLMSIYAVFVFDFTQSFIQFLSLMLIWIAPWSGIYLTDMLLRRNTYDAADLHRRGGGRYWYSGGWNWRAIGAWIAGMVAAAAFANAPIWVGPLVGVIGGGDLSVVAGFLVAGLGYYLLMGGHAAPVESPTLEPIVRAAS